MRVDKLIERLKELPKSYEVTFLQYDSYGSAHDVYADDIIVNHNRSEVRLCETYIFRNSD